MTLALFSSGEWGQFLEGAMIVCFGVSWPFSIYRTWKVKRVEGKSSAFLVIVLVGYMIGAASKLVKAYGGKPLEPVVICYALNTVLVAIDLALYLRYRSKNAASLAKDTISPPVE